MTFIDIIIFIILCCCLIIATYTDLKDRIIPNWVSYFLILSSLVLRTVQYFVYNDTLYLLLAFYSFIIGASIGLLLYFCKAWGGGDSKMLLGIFCACATTPILYFGIDISHILLGYNIMFLFNLLLVGSIYGTGYLLIKKIIKDKQVIPFIPAFLITFILTQLFGNITLNLVKELVQALV